VDRIKRHSHPSIGSREYRPPELRLLLKCVQNHVRPVSPCLYRCPPSDARDGADEIQQQGAQ
jgi:hypothetical protein